MAYAPPAPEPRTIAAQYVTADGRVIEGRNLTMTRAEFRELLLSHLHDCRSFKPEYIDDPVAVAYRSNFQDLCIKAASNGAISPLECERWMSLSNTLYPPKEADAEPSA